jgi:predicted regulator of Ras-like GTPase activity (Roadblock/LC7/MglB family)
MGIEATKVATNVAHMKHTQQTTIEGNRLELWLHRSGDKTFLHIVIAADELTESDKLKKLTYEGKEYDVIAQRFHRQRIQASLF